MAKQAKSTAGNSVPVSERLAVALRRTAEALAPPAGRVGRILEERARVLARAPAEDDAAEESVYVLRFGVRGSTYLIESRYVREVLQAPAVAPVPRASGFLVGVTNLRGELVPAFDLHLFLALPATAPASDSRLVVLGEDQAHFALPVEWIEPAAPVASAVLRSSESGPAPARRCILGLTAEGHTILDGAALLDEPGLFLQS